MQQSENSGPFQTIPERVEPTLTSYTANNLKPYTRYQFRIQATNDIGPSEWSTESAQVQTLPAGAYRMAIQDIGLGCIVYLFDKRIKITGIKRLIYLCLHTNYLFDILFENIKIQ